MLKKHKIFIFLISFVLTLAFVQFKRAYAFYEDVSKSGDNKLVATSLDLEFTSPQDSFEPEDAFEPGTVLEREGEIKNAGELPFIYSQEYEFISGEEDLCSALNLKVIYEYEDEGGTEEEEKYNGPLNEFEISGEDDDDLKHPNEKSGDEPHKFKYIITVPPDLDMDLADESCEFNIKASAWQEGYSVGEAYWDTEVLTQELETSKYDEPEDCEVGKVIFMIGEEEDEQEDNPVDEFNWAGSFDEYPEFDNPYKVGISETSDYPWNSKYNDDYAHDFDIDFFNPYEKSLVKITIGWSPGASGTEKKEVFLDGDSVGTTPEREGETVSGWWEDMERFEDEFEFVLDHGYNKLNMRQLMGDGTLWDYVRLEILSCGAEEGDVVINEIMWSGSSAHQNDFWIELRNMTSSDIDLDGWELYGSGPSFHSIDLSGTLEADSYYLISHFETDHSEGSSNFAAINDDISADLVDNLLLLQHQTGEQLILKSALGEEIDKTPEPEKGQDKGWVDGEWNSQGPYRSMERDTDPGDGTDEDNWHTCEGEDYNDTIYWDEEGDDYGTPKSENSND
ncbi:MAG: lamin tail domain-containing protein [Patescibacteria group bacterium]